MELHVRLEGRGDLARQIYRQIRAAIASGRLKRGDRLPPTRELAQRLDVSRNTVALAFEWLVAEGLLSGRSGAGTFVESDPAARGGRKPSSAQIRHRAIWNELTTLGRRGPAPPFDFGVGMPDAQLFPFEAWRRLQARQLHASMLSADYGNPAGHPKLREAIARHVGVARGVICRPEDVIVTNGAQQAFDLIARVLLEPNAQVAVEEPGYPPPRMLSSPSAPASRACRSTTRGWTSPRSPTRRAWSTSRPRISSPWACRCRTHAGRRCWTGRSGATR